MPTEPTPHRPPDGSVRVALSGVNGPSHWVNRFWLHVAYGTTPTGTQLLALSNVVAASFRTRFLPSLSTGVSSNSQRTVLYESATDELAVDGTDSGSGSIGTSETPAQVCALINWSISGSYRGGKPRTYLPGVVVADLSDIETLNTTRRNALTTAAGNFLADVNALAPAPFTSVSLGTIAFFRSYSALSPPIFKPFLAGTCRAKLATQRRRLGR